MTAKKHTRVSKRILSKTSRKSQDFFKLEGILGKNAKKRKLKLKDMRRKFLEFLASRSEKRRE